MTRTLSLAIVSALLLPLAARAQSTPAPSAQQPPKTADALEDDPAFRRLPPDEQEWIRNTLDKVHTAIANKDTAALDEVKADIAKHQGAAANPAPLPAPPKAAAPPVAQAAPSGCATPPVKKPKFHIPKVMQDAINKQTKQVSKQTGVDLDPNAPAQAVNDAQKNTPCPPAPAAPAPKPANQ
jgi:hypothetical protein